jgi:hypothetical protein
VTADGVVSSPAFDALPELGNGWDEAAVGSGDEAWPSRPG